MTYKHSLFALLALLAAMPAWAVPGLDTEVYPAIINPDMSELEVRYGRLTGGANAGERATVLELSHGFGSRFYGALLATFEGVPQQSGRLEVAGFEGIAYIGQAAGIDFAIYSEFEVPIHGGPVNFEAKSLIQKVAGNWDLRLNLVAERKISDGNYPIEFGYAASVDYAVYLDDIKFGVEAFGDIGSTDKFGGRQEHYIGPVGKFEIHVPGNSELEMQVAYLFAAGAARDISDGQFKLALAWEKRF